MKKLLIVAAALLGYVGILCSILPKRLPDMNECIPCMEANLNGNIILAENKNNKNNLYEIDSDGKIVKVYTAAKKDGYFIVNFEVTQDGTIYCIRQGLSRNSEQNNIMLSRINETWDDETVLGIIEHENNLSVSSAMVKDEKIYFIVLDRTEWKVMLFSRMIEGEGVEEARLELEMERDLPQCRVADATYDGNRLYVLQGNGKIGYYLPDSYRYFQQEDMERVMWMEAASSGLLYVTEAQDSIWFWKDDVNKKVCELSVEGLVDADCLGEGAGVTVLSREKDYTYTATMDEGRAEIPCNEIKYGWNIILKLCLDTVFAVSILYLVFLMLILLFWRRKEKYHTITATMIVSVVLINTVFVVLLTMYSYNGNKKELVNSRGISNLVSTRHETSDIMDRKDVNLGDLDAGKFYDTEWAAIIDEMFMGMEVYDVNAETIISFETNLVYDDGVHGYVLNAQDCVTGRSLYSYYEPEVVELINEVRGTNAAKCGQSEIGGHNYSIIVYPDAAENYFYIGRASLDDMEQRSWANWMKNLKWTCIYGITLAAFLVVVLYRQMRPVHRITRFMERVAGGIYDLPELVFPNNEYGRMWTYLHKMCKALSVQQYARGNVVKYYARFAPYRFEKLFGQDTLQKVAVGDTAAIDGTVGIVAVSQREQLTKKGIKGEYVRYINRLLESISTCNDKAGGILISRGNHLEESRAIYKEPEMTADAALLFGIESIQRLACEDYRYDIKPLILMHSGSFTCGLAGTSAQAYPFAASLELELLGTSISELKKLGIRLVMTEQTKEKIREKVKSRYIGSSTPLEGYTFRFYEVLEVCPKEEREQKAETADMMAEALGLYENNRFQEAGSLFLKIVKNCPTDMVAKRYLFACEERLQPGEAAAERETDESIQ